MPPVVVVAAVVGARARDATGKLSRVVLTRVVRLDLTSFVRPLKLLDNAFRYLSLASEDYPYNRAVFILQSCYEIRLAEKYLTVVIVSSERIGRSFSSNYA